jgi:hypothetical protein
VEKPITAAQLRAIYDMANKLRIAEDAKKVTDRHLKSVLMKHPKWQSLAMKRGASGGAGGKDGTKWTEAKALKSLSDFETFLKNVPAEIQAKLPAERFGKLAKECSTMEANILRTLATDAETKKAEAEAAAESTKPKVKRPATRKRTTKAKAS